ncbi:MAG: hypothetical protein ACLUD2_09160 [Clostridium sp.]
MIRRESGDRVDDTGHVFAPELLDGFFMEPRILHPYQSGRKGLHCGDTSWSQDVGRSLWVGMYGGWAVRGNVITTSSNGFSLLFNAGSGGRSEGWWLCHGGL